MLFVWHVDIEEVIVIFIRSCLIVSHILQQLSHEWKDGYIITPQFMVYPKEKLCVAWLTLGELKIGI